MFPLWKNRPPKNKEQHPKEETEDAQRNIRQGTLRNGSLVQQRRLKGLKWRAIQKIRHKCNGQVVGNNARKSGRKTNARMIVGEKIVSENHHLTWKGEKSLKVDTKGQHPRKKN